MPEDYSQQRKRANTYAVGAKRPVQSPARKPLEVMEETDSVDGVEITISEEERKQRVSEVYIIMISPIFYSTQ